MKHILWLASWYPDKLQPLNGDFIERHAKAASLFNRITVLHVVRDNQNLTGGKFLIERRKYNEFCFATILYYKPYSNIKFIERSVAGLRYFIFYSELIREHIHNFGKPDLLHVHVSWRAGLLALYCKWKYKLPFAVTEHWTGFLPGAHEHFSKKGGAAKKVISKVFRKAQKVSAVSEVLAASLADRFKIQKPFVVPNVVDTSLFLPGNNKNSIFTFLHISELTAAKNPQDILRAVILLSKKTKTNFQLVFYSPIDKDLVEFVKKSGIEKMVRFEGHVPHTMIATALSQADCLILYSSYETFGCVVIEANACGLPVIVSEIPVMHELVNNENGIFVNLNNPELLAEKMLWMMNNHFTAFDSKQIAIATEERFGMKTIGKKFQEFYNA